MVDVRREVKVWAEDVQNVDSDECRKPNCICKDKREGKVEGTGGASIVNASTRTGEKNGLLE